jgi:hypothetical protein
LSAPQIQTASFVGKPDSLTRMDELDELLDLLANDVVGTKSASGLTFSDDRNRLP